MENKKSNEFGMPKFLGTVIQPENMYLNTYVTDEIKPINLVSGLIAVKEENLQTEHKRVIKANTLKDHKSWRNFLPISYIVDLCKGYIKEGKIGGVVFNSKVARYLSEETTLTKFGKDQEPVNITKDSSFNDGLYFLGDEEKALLHDDIKEIYPYYYLDKAIRKYNGVRYSVSPLQVLADMEELLEQGYYAIYTNISNVLTSKHLSLWDKNKAVSYSPFMNPNYLSLNSDKQIKSRYRSENGVERPFGVTAESSLLLTLREINNSSGIVYTLTDQCFDLSRAKDIEYLAKFYLELCNYRGNFKALKRLSAEDSNYVSNLRHKYLNQFFEKKTINGVSKYYFNQQKFALLQTILRLSKGLDVLVTPELVFFPFQTKLNGKSINTPGALNEDGLLVKSILLEGFKAIEENPRTTAKEIITFKAHDFEYIIPNSGLCRKIRKYNLSEEELSGDVLTDYKGKQYIEVDQVLSDFKFISVSGDRHTLDQLTAFDSISKQTVKLVWEYSTGLTQEDDLDFSDLIDDTVEESFDDLVSDSFGDDIDNL